MRLPNLLGTRRGRLFAFFSLYVTEGIPLGFAATAVATQLRRQGVGPAEIGAFVASFYLPWAFKWAFGPFVDVFRSQRFGHRRGWILLTQIVMAATLLSLVAVPLPAGLGLFTMILLVHNTFGAIQDVAIDSLACNTLSEDERGLANGLMFAGAAVGQAVGGSGVLFLIGITGFQFTFVAVAAAILAVTGFIVLPMKETVAASLGAAAESAGDAWRRTGAEMKSFAVQSFRSFIGTRGAFSGVFFALLPAGAMSLGLALQSNLAVEVGMNDDQVGALNLWTSIISAVCMVLGGWLSDKWGRRRTLFVYLAGMSLPVLYLMFVLQQHGYVMPRAPGGPELPALITALWISSLVYSVFQGLMYGTRSAIMMDITNPAVAATQFTAYMAMMNLAIAIAASWQGAAVEAWGYPVTLPGGRDHRAAVPDAVAHAQAADRGLQRRAGRRAGAQVVAGAGHLLPGLAALLGQSRTAGQGPADDGHLLHAGVHRVGPLPAGRARGAGPGRGRVAPRGPVGFAAAAPDVRPLLGREAQWCAGVAQCRRGADIRGAAGGGNCAGCHGFP